MEQAAMDRILDKLEEVYHDDACGLDFGTPFELLVATMLSAQCTDVRVNMVTEKLYAVMNTPEQFAELTPEELEPAIKSCGFYHNKAKNIIAASRAILQNFGGEVPQTMEELTSLPGVGRKTANVVMANAWGKDAIAVDTHVFRVSNRLGLAQAKDVEKTEQQLMAHIPKDKWSQAHHWLIWHGRRICHARKPECGRCPVAEWCPSAPIL